MTNKKSDIPARKLVDWLNSEEGIKAFKESMELADKAIAELRKARQVDWRTLHKPFGPADGSGIWPHQCV